MNPTDPSPDQENTPRAHTPDMDSNLPPGADAEERFNEFMRANGASILISILVGAVIVIGAQTWRYLNRRAEEKTQAAFSQAGTNEELLAFAQSHSSHKLAGVAYMELANDDYAKGQYKQAAEYYAQAGDKLAGTPFGERAQLGAAMSELVGGSAEAGVIGLHAVLDNPDLLEVTRAEAAFNLALHYLQEQDYKALAGVADMADTFGEKNVYAEMTRSMRNQIPQEK